MPARLSPYSRQRIVFLSQEGRSISQITELLRKEGIFTTKKTVSCWIFRWSSQSGLVDNPRVGRPSKITADIGKFIEESLKSDDELSSLELHRLVNRKFHVSISAPAIRYFIRKKLKWILVRNRFRPMISAANKERRLAFAREMISSRDTFDDVIWTDESTVQLSRHAKYVRIQMDKERELKPAPKHAVKVNVWAGISKKGATSICIFDSIIDSTLYISILKEFLVPFINSKFTSGYCFQQDNDPKHTSRLSRQFYEDAEINWWPTPASSPDINPIKCVWHHMKHYISRHVKPLNKRELVEGIEAFWSKMMTPQQCRQYIGHVHKVLPKVVQKGGGITGE